MFCILLQTIEVLLEFGADILTSNNRGDLPLHAIIRAEYNHENKLAAKDRQNCVLVLLAYANCDPNCRNLKDGATPLHVAAQVIICDSVVFTHAHTHINAPRKP